MHVPAGAEAEGHGEDRGPDGLQRSGEDAGAGRDEEQVGDGRDQGHQALGSGYQVSDVLGLELCRRDNKGMAVLTETKPVPMVYRVPQRRSLAVLLHSAAFFARSSYFMMFKMDVMDWYMA